MSAKHVQTRCCHSLFVTGLGSKNLEIFFKFCLATMSSIPCQPGHYFADATSWLLWCAAISLVLVAAIHYFVIVVSRQLSAGYRGLPAQTKIDWNQSVTMTMIIPSLLFIGFTAAHFSCSGTVRLRISGFAPWSRGGACESE